MTAQGSQTHSAVGSIPCLQSSLLLKWLNGVSCRLLEGVVSVSAGGVSIHNRNCLNLYRAPVKDILGKEPKEDRCVTYSLQERLEVKGRWRP